MPLVFPDALRVTRANALVTRAGANAILRIYTGTQPATADTAPTGTLLSEHTCAATFGTVSAEAVTTANAIANDTSANAGGTPGWARVFQSDGTTVAFDVGAESMSVTPATISAGQPVTVNSLVITEGNASSP